MRLRSDHYVVLEPFVLEAFLEFAKPAGAFPRFSLLICHCITITHLLFFETIFSDYGLFVEDPRAELENRLRVGLAQPPPQGPP